MTVVRAVLLDIDDTVLDTTAAMITAGCVGMAALWPQQGDAWHTRAAVRFRNDPGGFFGRYVRGELAFEEMRRLRLTELADHAGVRLPADAIADYDRVYRPAFERAQRVFPDVRPFLDRCAEHDVVVGALTNSARSITADKLTATGTTGWFEVVVTRDDLGYGKPDPRVFQHACVELGAAAPETAYIGDELEADVLGASRAGLRPVWVRRPVAPGGHHRPHQGEAQDGIPADTVVVPDLTTLADLLDLGSPGRGR